MPVYCGCIEYELEVQRMIYEGGRVFQDYLPGEQEEHLEKKKSNGEEE